MQTLHATLFPLQLERALQADADQQLEVMCETGDQGQKLLRYA